MDLGRAARRTSTALDEVERLAADVRARGRRAGVRHRRRRRSGASPATSRRTERAGVYGRIGTCTQEFGTLASWLVDVVNVLAGNLDREGGAMFTHAGRGERHERPACRPGPGAACSSAAGRAGCAARPRSSASTRSACLADEIETPGDGQIRALITVAGQPGAVHARRRAPRPRARVARLHGERRHLPQRDDAPRRRDPARARRCSRKGHYDLALYSLAIRNVANYSPPVVDLAAGRDGGVGDPAPPRARSLDGPRHATSTSTRSTTWSPASWCRRRSARSGSQRRGPRRRRADRPRSNRRRGPERVLDLMLRTGPYGDGFGADPDGLSLAVLEANPHGVDLGPLQPRLPEVLRRRVRHDRARARGDRRRRRARLRAVARPAARNGETRARRSARPAVEQLVDAQPRGAREGQAALHAPDPPRRRRRRASSTHGDPARVASASGIGRSSRSR